MDDLLFSTHYAVKHALNFACMAHKGQKRKYTGEPYFAHLYEVYKILSRVGPYHYGIHIDEYNALLCAGIMHDIIEDTEITPYEIEILFNKTVAELVLEVTDISKPEDGNRAIRKAIDCEHLSKASALGQTIKLADILSNTSSIVKHDPDFAKIYLKEKDDLLKVLTKGDQVLLNLAYKNILELQLELELYTHNP